MKRAVIQTETSLFIFFTAICFLLAVASSLVTSVSYSRFQQRLDRYGQWQAAIITCYEGTKRAVERHASVTQTGEISIIGEVFTDSGAFCCNIGSIDEAGRGLGRLTLTQGQWPTRPDEIVLENSTLFYLNIPADVGTKFTLEVTCTGADNKPLIKKTDFVLCGILPSYSANWQDKTAVSGIVADNCRLFDETNERKTILIGGNFSPARDVFELSNLVGKNETFVFTSGAYPEIGTGLFFSTKTAWRTQ